MLKSFMENQESEIRFKSILIILFDYFLRRSGPNVGKNEKVLLDVQCSVFTSMQGVDHRCTMANIQ